MVKAAKGSARAAPNGTGRFFAITSRVLRSLPFDVSLVVLDGSFNELRLNNVGIFPKQSEG